MKTADYSKISIIAKLTAYMRQFSDIPFASNVAKIIDAKATIDDLLQEHNLKIESLHWYALLFEARYKSISSMILQEDTPQIIELASGFSLRGLFMAHKYGISYLETDLADLNTGKEAILDQVCRINSISKPREYQCANLNALDKHEFIQVSKILNQDAPVTIVSEGLLQYLSEDEIMLLLQNIHDLLAKTGGCWITPDFTVKSPYQNISPEQQTFRQIISQYISRNMYNHTFNGDAELDKLLAWFGFAAEKFEQLELAGELETLKHMTIPESLLNSLVPQMKLWRLRTV